MAGLQPAVQVDGRRANLRELCLTRAEAEPLSQLAATLHGEGGTQVPAGRFARPLQTCGRPLTVLVTGGLSAQMAGSVSRSAP